MPEYTWEIMACQTETQLRERGILLSRQPYFAPNVQVGGLPGRPIKCKEAMREWGSRGMGGRIGTGYQHKVGHAVGRGYVPAKSEPGCGGDVTPPYRTKCHEPTSVGMRRGMDSIVELAPRDPRRAHVSMAQSLKGCFMMIVSSRPGPTETM